MNCNHPSKERTCPLCRGKYCYNCSDNNIDTAENCISLYWICPHCGHESNPNMTEKALEERGCFDEDYMVNRVSVWKHNL